MKNMDERLEKAFELFDQGYLHEAEVMYTDVLSTLKDTESEAYDNALFGLGYVKVALNDFRSARNIYQELLQKADKKDDKKNKAIYLHQLGMVERMAGNYEKAKLFFNNEWDIYIVYFPAFALGFSANLYEQGYILRKQENVEAAQEKMQLSLDYALQSEDPISIGCSNRGLGEIHCMQNNRVLGNEYFKKAIKAFEQADDLIAVQDVVTIIQRWER